MRENKEINFGFQLKLVDSSDYNFVEMPKKKKRIRYEIPSYKKVYSIYQYDQQKYMNIFEKVQKLANKYSPKIFYNTNPYKVLKSCYIKDYEGNLQHQGDARHIFRLKTLYKIYTEIYKNIETNPFNEFYKENGLLIWFSPGEKEAYLSFGAELENTSSLPINKRVSIHVFLSAGQI